MNELTKRIIIIVATTMLAATPGLAVADWGKILDLGGKVGKTLIENKEAFSEIPEPREIEMGDGMSAQLLGAAPLVDDADLQRYVTEVHTLSSHHEALALSIVAEATATSCGRELPLRILRSTAENGPQDATISVAFPPCDTLGEFVVLKNLTEDLKVAHN